MFPRVVSREVLDDLVTEDPRAMQSRRDLQRVHWALGTRTILLRALKEMPALRRTKLPLRILELGAGDGSLMLSVARALGSNWQQVDLTLLDAQPLITQEIIRRYSELGWTAVASVQDVSEWAAGASREDRDSGSPVRWDLVIANLFLHHFDGAQLCGLLRAIADRSDRFLACEPRRARLSLVGSHLIGVLGTNAVTREDAVLSVHAGFRGSEITALWSNVGEQWKVREYAAGLFSHCFSAEPIQVD